MATLRVDELKPCPLCAEAPCVEREEARPRKTVYHLRPCCPAVRRLLTEQRRRTGTFDFPSEAQEGPASKSIEPFETKQQAVEEWNKAVDKFRSRPQEADR